MRPFDYVRPASLGEATALLQEHGADALLLAGGTDLMVGLRDGKIAARLVIDLKRARDLPPVMTEADGWLTISATMALSDIQRNESVRFKFPALAEAAAVVGSIQIRNRATLVGNVCNASPAADTVPVLAVYGAEVKITGAEGERSVPVVDFIVGNRRTVLARGEMATAVRIPLPERPFDAAFARMTRRRGVDLASVNVCCGIDATGVVTFAFGAVSPRPLLVRNANGVLADPCASAGAKESALDALVAQASPISDVRASAQYRTAMLKVLAKRAQRRAAQRLRERMQRG